MHEDRSGALWFGGGKGLARYEHGHLSRMSGSRTFTRSAGLSFNTQIEIEEASAAQNDDSVLADGMVTSIVESSDGALFFAYRNGWLGSVELCIERYDG